MATQTGLTVQGKILGRSRPPFPDWDVPVPPEMWHADQLTLRDLITHIVLEEVKAFEVRQEERKLLRVLSRAEIEQGAVSGKVSKGGRDLNQAVDPREAVSLALLAFQDRLYFVFIDGAQGISLEQPVRALPGSTVLFLRLVPLVGG